MATKTKKKTSTKKGIGFAPLTERIYLGRQNREKGEWIGEKEDITNDFLNICFQYFPENTSRVIGTPSSMSRNMFMNIKMDEKSIKSFIKELEKELKDLGDG